MSLEQEAIAYFRKRPAFQGLFQLFKQKYESLGRASGTVSISTFNKEELEDISLFYGVSIHHLQRKGKVELAAFEKKLQGSRFINISLHRLLELYFDERILSKSDITMARESRRARLIADFSKEYLTLSFWFQYLEEKTPDTQWILRIIEEPEFSDHVRILAKAVASLPKSEEVERFPLFSQRVSGNPHQFDMNRREGKLLLHILFIKQGGRGAQPAGTEALNELLLVFGLLRDDIANFVTVANLIGWCEDQPHPVWYAAKKSGSVLNLPLRELVKVNRVTADIHNIFIVENSGVFSALLDAVPDAPLICTHGQFKYSGLLLMDLLNKSGARLYYNGDFDPEGLSMSHRFKERYGERASLWRMTTEDYYASNPMVELNEERKRKLNQLVLSELQGLAEVIKETGKAGYQEAILDLLVEDLKFFVHCK